MWKAIKHWLNTPVSTRVMEYSPYLGKWVPLDSSEFSSTPDPAEPYGNVSLEKEGEAWQSTIYY